MNNQILAAPTSLHIDIQPSLHFRVREEGGKKQLNQCGDRHCCVLLLAACLCLAQECNHCLFLGLSLPQLSRSLQTSPSLKLSGEWVSLRGFCNCAMYLFLRVTSGVEYVVMKQKENEKQTRKKKIKIKVDCVGGWGVNKAAVVIVTMMKN